jgi:hypothetical protein
MQGSIQADILKQSLSKRKKSLGAGQYIKKLYTLEKIGLAIKNELKLKK